MTGAAVPTTIQKSLWNVMPNESAVRAVSLGAVDLPLIVIIAVAMVATFRIVRRRGANASLGYSRRSQLILGGLELGPLGLILRVGCDSSSRVSLRVGAGSTGRGCGGVRRDGEELLAG